MPDDLDAGWAMLSPAMQGRVGRDSYDGFWATIDSTDATDVRAVGSDQVSARITYTRTDGSVTTENQVLSAGAGRRRLPHRRRPLTRPGTASRPAVA